ncbi:MAG: hypothetical protein LC105_06110 [Chitinophagales bacterium]|nr:hypothetical protein [Chitinophagales bacterium]
MKIQNRQAKDIYLKHLDNIRNNSRVNIHESKADTQEAIDRAKKDVRFCVERYFPHYASSPSADFHIKFANKVIKDKEIIAFAQWGRGLAKSVWCDVIIPFWLWINGESNYIVLIGQNYDKSKQLLGDIQAEFEANPQIIHDFGAQKLEGSWEDGDFRTVGNARLGLKPFIGKALGMGQEVRGLRIGAQRPDLCIVDDVETRDINKNPKRQDEYVKWIETALIPTMDGDIRRMLYANNRFAPRMIQTELQKKHPNWYVSHVSAYERNTFLPVWKEKYPKNYYKKLNSQIGIIALEQEYLQEPIVEGKIFKPEQIIWDDSPRLNQFKAIVGHWDIAYAGTDKSDYNAVRIWGLDKNNIFWYLQSFVKQTKMKEAVSYMCEVQKNLPKTVIIHWQYESQFWNDEVERTIREESQKLGVQLLIRKTDTPRTKKFDRMLTMQPRYQNNRIRYSNKMKADNDTQVGLAQLYSLEPGYSTHDDAPDADEQCIAFLEKYILDDNKGSTEVIMGKMQSVNEAL